MSMPERNSAAKRGTVSGNIEYSNTAITWENRHRPDRPELFHSTFEIATPDGPFQIHTRPNWPGQREKWNQSQVEQLFRESKAQSLFSEKEVKELYLMSTNVYGHALPLFIKHGAGDYYNQEVMLHIGERLGKPDVAYSLSHERGPAVALTVTRRLLPIPSRSSFQKEPELKSALQIDNRGIRHVVNFRYGPAKTLPLIKNEDEEGIATVHGKWFELAQFTPDSESIYKRHGIPPGHEGFTPFANRAAAQALIDDINDNLVVGQRMNSGILIEESYMRLNQQPIGFIVGVDEETGKVLGVKKVNKTAHDPRFGGAVVTGFVGHGNNTDVDENGKLSFMRGVQREGWEEMALGVVRDDGTEVAVPLEAVTPVQGEDGRMRAMVPVQKEDNTLEYMPAEKVILRETVKAGKIGQPLEVMSLDGERSLGYVDYHYTDPYRSFDTFFNLEPAGVVQSNKTPIDTVHTGIMLVATSREKAYKVAARAKGEMQKLDWIDIHGYDEYLKQHPEIVDPTTLKEELSDSANPDEKRIFEASWNRYAIEALKSMFPRTPEETMPSEDMPSETTE